MLTDAHKPVEVSLVENLGRSAMHAADEIMAFKTLHEEEGLSPEAIGDRFGISHMSVRRRLKLATLSPKIIDELRAGSATLQQCEALAITDNQQAQEEAYFGASSNYYRSPDNLRSLLTTEHVRMNDRLATFVGLGTYEAAGGHVLRDLFAAQEGSGFLTDRPLLVKLAMEKLEAAAEPVRAEGWKWVEVALERPYISAAERHYPKFVPLTPEQQARDAELEAERDALEGELEQLSEDDDAEHGRIQALINKIDEEAEAMQVEAYEDGVHAFCGAYLSIGYNGAISIERGIVLPEDRDASRAYKAGISVDELAIADAATAPAEVKEEDAKGGLSAAVIEDLTKARSAALAIEVSRRPDIALVAIVHALAKSVFYKMSSGEPAIVIKPTVTDLRVATADADNIAPFEAVAELRQQWAARLPEKAAALWDWCLDQKLDTLSSLLAFLVGSSVDAVRYSNHSSGWDRDRVAHADRLAEAVALDMTKWWHPGQEFFRRVPKAIAMQAVTEAGCDPAVAKGIEKAKKGDAVAAAEQALEGRGWLPAVLRGSRDAAVEDDDEFADDESEQIDADLDEGEPDL